MNASPEKVVQVWLDAALWRGMADAAFLHAPMAHSGRETGGVLLGWRDAHNVVVEHVVGAGPAARHGRASFQPDASWQQARVAQLYEQSGRRLSYLGDWHTHPGGKPIPSRRDDRTLQHIASAAEARCPDPIMVIMGDGGAVRDRRWAARAFVLRDPTWWRVWERPASLAALHITS
jgi:integrative and conjugative element protein (TIGR02256 family)